jgi:hypothetical protein
MFTFALEQWGVPLAESNRLSALGPILSYVFGSGPRRFEGGAQAPDQ